MPNIFIKATVNEIAAGLSLEHAPEFFQVSHGNAVVNVHFTGQLNGYNLEISCLFTYDVGPRRYEAFEAVTGQYLLLSQPPAGSITQFFNDHSKEWHLPASVFNVLRWMYDFNGQPRISLYWSLDGEHFAQIGRDAINIRVNQSPIFSQGLVTFFIENNLREPVAFDLLKEAQSLKSDSPRSALILFAVALEVGAKTYIRKKCAHCGDLLTAMKSSPPMEKLICNFLPTLDPMLTLTDETQRQVQNLFNQRNDLVHKGSLFGNLEDGNNAIGDLTAETGKKLWEFSLLVQDLLYHFEESLQNGFVEFGVHISKNRLVQARQFIIR